jgi:hypothetical protein
MLMALVIGFTANANFESMAVMEAVSQQFSTQFAAGEPMFKEGESATYDMTIAGFIPATMVMSIKSVTATDVVLNQTMSIFGQEQSCDISMDPNTGAIKKMVCNGQEQKPPEGGEIEVIESKEASVTVPAGTFQSIYFKVKQKSDSSIIEQWINPKLVPVGGMIKSIIPSKHFIFS